MSATKNLRAQHNELLKIVSEISEHLNTEELSKDANEVMGLLSRLIGKLNMHLAIEDKSLYPRLLNHTDEKVKSIAQEFIDEMGGIGEAVNAYKKSWPDASKIQSAPSEFIDQTNGIFAALANRIKRENGELYKIVDELG